MRLVLEIDRVGYGLSTITRSTRRSGTNQPIATPTNSATETHGTKNESGSQLAEAIGSDRKGKLSLAAYAVALAFSFVVPWVSVALFVGVAISWFVPDRRVERVIVDKP